MQVRGYFKVTFIASNSYSITVARYTRAWIETGIKSRADGVNVVARYTRAWIETTKLLLKPIP